MIFEWKIAKMNTEEKTSSDVARGVSVVNSISQLKRKTLRPDIFDNLCL